MASNISYDALFRRLRKSVCIVRFKRRHPKPGFSNYRRMVCTLNVEILNTEPWKKVLRYKQPKGYPKYKPREKNLIIVYDILKRDFRCINCDNVKLLEEVPADWGTWEQFWFNHIARLRAAEKEEYMDS
jgi:hypothetical protein